MLYKDEQKYEVTLVLNNTERTLVCNQAEMLTFVNSQINCIVMDAQTGEIIWHDYSAPCNNGIAAEAMIHDIRLRKEYHWHNDELESYLLDLAEELNILDDLNHPVTKDDILAEIDRLRDENIKLDFEKFNKDNISPALRRIYNIHIMDLDLTVRSYNCLKRAGIEFVEDILQMTEEDMIKIRNLGKRSLKEIIAKLAELGVTLKGSELSFEEKVAVCCKYHNKCRLCPLHTNSVDCFYNESQHNMDHVDIAMGKEPDWLNPDLDLTPTIHPEDEYTADDISEFNSFYEAAGVEDEDENPEKYPDGSGWQIVDSLSLLKSDSQSADEEDQPYAFDVTEVVDDDDDDDDLPF